MCDIEKNWKSPKEGKKINKGSF